jgi:TolB protein
MAKKTMRQLTYDDGIATSPSYSPDGKKMAFESNRSGSQQVHVLDLKTLDVQRLTYGGGKYGTPAWGPRGDFIAFTKISSDTFYVGIISPNGKIEKILSSGWFMEMPSWAPGGRRIVFHKTDKIDDDERVSRIISVDINGQNEYEIKLPEGINGVEASWSPKLP